MGAELAHLKKQQMGIGFAPIIRLNGGKAQVMNGSQNKLTQISPLSSILVLPLVLTALVGCSSGSSTPGSTAAGSPTETAKRLGAQGTVDGGGGKGVVCKAADGSETVKILDLFESEIVRSEATEPNIASASTLEDMVTIATRKLTVMLRDPMSLSFSEGELKTYIANFLKTEFDDRLKPQRTPLPLTADATVPTLPKNCQTVQIAIWQPNGEIALDLNLWEKLGVRDQAALKLHEYVYFYARKEGATTSDETRWLIGSAFSSLPLQPRFPESMFTPDAKVLWCGGGGGGAPYDGPNFELYGQEESEGGAVGTALYLHYTRAGSAQAFNALTRTRVFVAGLTLERMKAGDWPASIKFRNSLRNYTWSFDTTNLPLTFKVQDPSGLTGLSNSFCRYHNR